MQTDPPVQGADAPFRDAIAKEQRNLLDFYAAALYAYQGDRARSAQTMERVLEEDADNPYFRWIAGLPPK